MDLPSSLINSLIKEKSIFYFVSDKINTTEPHNFILLKNSDNKIIVFSCCTTKHQTITRYIQRNNYPIETMASIDYNNYDFLKSPTFINCNSKTIYPYEVFKGMYDSGKIKYRGDISTDEYNLIVAGMLLSDDIEGEIKDLFK
jgi:hypothetical protein